jgi:hypothetical protein
LASGRADEDLLSDISGVVIVAVFIADREMRNCCRLLLVLLLLLEVS